MLSTLEMATIMTGTNCGLSFRGAEAVAFEAAVEVLVGVEVEDHLLEDQIIVFWSQVYAFKYSYCARKMLPIFVPISGLPPTGSWQDLKDHMREAGDVCFADVYKDGTGVCEYVKYEDMKYALKKLDDSKFRSHEVSTFRNILLISCLKMILGRNIVCSGERRLGRP